MQANHCPMHAQVEAAGTLTAITCSSVTGCPLYVVHVTCKAAARIIGDARRERRLVFGEVVTAGTSSLHFLYSKYYVGLVFKKLNSTS